MQITIEIQVRFSDLDCYGHVNNAVYLSYLETARVHIIRDLFLEDMKRNIQYLLVRADLKYILPITLADRVFVHCWFSEIGKVRFKASYSLHNGEGKIFAEGYTEHALFNANTKRPIRIPKEWQKFVES
ncbi:MAG: acyl-CoA thioesterase [Deferribacteraceae bacterium]|jgi:acyl-CoA thioester hydrolase|nr:acyl-CoA thioesterase [Deferribacteraceae bacterium]